jgi:ABC-type branched-subunit amino acid transport system substrate-binding protein
VAAAKTATPDYRQILRTNLFGEGKIGSDMQFAFVNGKNILSVYQNFVDKVADNKKKYTREDWDEIKVLYEALDTRKNEVEKDLAGGDNMKIAGLKIRFASIIATHRGGAKVKENAASKE